jgi:hypothetical protein
MARYADEQRGTELGGVAHRVARRKANREKAARADTEADLQGLVEFACECTREDCERMIRVPLYVYRRLLDAASDQYLLQPGHHAFEHYRTIMSLGLVRIEEKA